MKAALFNLGLSSLLIACGLLAYDRWVAKPAQVIGVVDVAEIYRQKEAEITSHMTIGSSEESRQQALQRLQGFARRFDSALEELPNDCHCLVVLKSAVVGKSTHTRDLTELLQAKLETKREAP